MVKEMPLNVIGSSTSGISNTHDTSSFVQKPYSRIDYIESDIEDYMDMRNQKRIKNLRDPISIRETASQNYVETFTNNLCLVKNTVHVDFNRKIIDNVRFVKVTSCPGVGEHLSGENYIDEASSSSVDESALVKINPEEESELTERDSMILISTLTSPEIIS